MSERLPAIRESQTELEQLLKKHRKAQVRRRIHLLILIVSGAVRSKVEAAQHLAVHRNSIGRWLSSYVSGGLPSFLQIRRGAPKAEQKSLPEPAFQALQEQLKGGGFPGGYVEAQRWLKEEFAVEVSYKTLHAIVRYRLKAKLKRARPSHVKKTMPTSRPSRIA